MSATSALTVDFTTPLPNSESGDLSRGSIWTGRVISGFISVLLAMDAGLKVYVAIMLWGGLWLRDRRLRSVFAKLQ